MLLTVLCIGNDVLSCNYSRDHLYCFEQCTSRLRHRNYSFDMRAI